MTPKVCICCGEAMADQANHFSRNPNMCASCSSMVDGMDDATLPQGGEEQASPLELNSLSDVDPSEEVVIRQGGRRIT